MVENVTQIKSLITISINVNVKIFKKDDKCKKVYTWDPATWICENAKYVGSISYDLVITCDETVDKTESILAKIVATKIVPTRIKSKNFFILLAFLLVSIPWFIAVSIYCYWIKY